MKTIRILRALLLLSVCLAGCGGAGNSAEKDALCTYTVSCRGEDGAGVAGVMINFCTDSACTPVTSGETALPSSPARRSSIMFRSSGSRKAGSWRATKNGPPRPGARTL